MKLIKQILLAFKNKIVLLLSAILLSSLPSGLKGQDISTVGEIYDYELGDIFHIDYSAGGNGQGINSITNVEIIEKYYSPNSDTVFYVRDVDYQEISSLNPVWTFEYYIDTIYYNRLDSLIHFGQIDSVYSDPDFYNERLINFRQEVTEYYIHERKFVNGCGYVWSYYQDYVYDSQSTIQLVYYKKGNEEWGIPIPVSIKDNPYMIFDINVYPNPVEEDLITFDFQKTLQHDNIELRCFNVIGELVHVEKIYQHQGESTLNVIDWDKGMYIGIVYSNGNVYGQCKFVIAE